MGIIDYLQQQQFDQDLEEPALLFSQANKDAKFPDIYLFNKFGIEDFKEVKVKDLSTGMKQKVSLVISIVHDPDFIIFDEPTNGLDIITAKSVTDFLIDLKIHYLKQFFYHQI